ncbi:MAG: hypothetical protein ACPHRO_02190 [Nannocystaceae bacterium]
MKLPRSGFGLGTKAMQMFYLFQFALSLSLLSGGVPAHYESDVGGDEARVSEGSGKGSKTEQQTVSAGSETVAETDIEGTSRRSGREMFRNASIPTWEMLDVPDDPEMRDLVLGAHFLVSNENDLHLFHEVLTSRSGGGYVGVGTEQNFVLAGWSRPEFALIIDIDSVVVGMFSIYETAFAEAETPAEFLNFWSEAHVLKARRSLARSGFGEHMQLYTDMRKKVARRFDFLGKRFSRLGLPWVLDDQEQYDHVREMFRTGAWQVRHADFSGAQTLRTFADVLNRLDAKVNTLYLSNIEDYLKYGDGFRSNIRALPAAKDAVTLHTCVRREKEGLRWCYIVQGLENFQSWLAMSPVRTLKDIVGGSTEVYSKLVEFAEKPSLKYVQSERTKR